MQDLCIWTQGVKKQGGSINEMINIYKNWSVKC